MEAFTSALDLAAAIKRKEISPLEVVDFYLNRIDRLNPELNAIIWRRDEELRREAEAATDAVMAGGELAPFHGVPIPVKDLTDVTDWPTTYGCKATLSRVASTTAAVVEGFKSGGFLLMCRTNTPEFGTVCVTENDAYGATRNPWDTGRTPGGSSGGAASAVAAGLAPVAHANDGGGSIRIPAACTGLVGLKPSRGRVSMGPLVSDVMHGGAVEGCVSHTVADTAAVLDAISAVDPHAWYNAPAPERPFLEEVGAAPGKLRIAFTTEAPTGVPVDPECVTAVEKTASLLEELGHDVFEGTPEWPEPAEIMPAFMVVWNTGSAYWDVEEWDKIEPLNAALREQALAMDSISYVRGVLGLQIVSRLIVASWGRDFDILLTPTCATLPPEIGWLWEGSEQDPTASLAKASTMAPFTPLFNITGQPAISLPMHWSESGLPTGVQLVGAPWDEAGLIRVSAQLEEAANWTERKPPLG